MDCPITALMDPEACYRKRVDLLHPRGLTCPRCGNRDRLGVHRRHRAPVLDYRCPDCGRVFNAFAPPCNRCTARVTLERLVVSRTSASATVSIDEWSAYGHLAESGRGHATVCHAPGRREWARDGDGDGVREVHNNTLEGIWTGLRNSLRPFRGVHKKYLGQYVALFQWAYNLQVATEPFLRMLPGVPPGTASAT
jgi:transposase-like protein